MSIEQLAAKLAAVPCNARGRRRYSAKLRRETVAAFGRSELTRKEFCARVGITGMNLFRWRDQAGSARREQRRGAFKPIEVAPEASEPGDRLRVRAPGGVVVEDLSVDAVADLLVALARRASC